VIAERIGWGRGMTVLTARVRELAAGVSATGPVVEDGLRGRGDRAARLLVPRHRSAGRVRADPHRQADCRC
jgi:hypothetical protein